MSRPKEKNLLLPPVRIINFMSESFSSLITKLFSSFKTLSLRH